MLGTVNITVANTEEIYSALDNRLYTSNNASPIPSDADLNDYITPGRYVNNYPNNTIANLPSIEDITIFTLQVISFGTIDGVTNLLQTVTDKSGTTASRSVCVDSENNTTFSEWIIGGGSSMSSEDILRIKYDQWISDIHSYGVQSRIWKDNSKVELLKEDGEVYKDNVTNVLVSTSDLKVGDEITIHHNIMGNIPLVVIGKNHDAEGSLTFMTKEVVKILPFDGKEPSNTDTNRQSYGNNRYKYSNILQWLNSDKAAGEWYTAQHSTDAPPDSVNNYNIYSRYYDNVDGLLKGFDKSLVDSMITVDKTTVIPAIDGGGSEVIPSKVFLLSTTEVGLGNENDIAEGEIYEYFSNDNANERRFAYLSEYCVNDARTYNNAGFKIGNMWYWTLRTPDSYSSYFTRAIANGDDAGTLGPNYANYINTGLRFAFTLPTNCTLSTISTEKVKTSYYVGESFGSTDMEVKAIYEDGTSSIINNSLLTYTPSILTADDTSVKIEYTENNITKYTNIAIVVKDLVTTAANASVGDEIVLQHSLYGDIPFIVIGKNHDADNSVTLLTRDIIKLLSFDTKEANNTDTNRQEYGNNRYKYSNILQWMNSDKAGGKWYTAQHEYDAPPDSDNVDFNPYTNVDGFLKGFSNDIANQMITVDKTTVIPKIDGGGSEVIPSKVFLLSTTEVGLGNENSIAEGKIYEYFSNNNVDSQRLAYPSTYCLNNAGGYRGFASGKPWLWLLRTPSSGNSFAVCGIHTDGAPNSYHVHLGNCGLRLALSLKTT